MPRRSPEYDAAYQAHVETLPRLHELLHAKHELKQDVDEELNALLVKRDEIWERITAAASQENLRNVVYR